MKKVIIVVITILLCLIGLSFKFSIDEIKFYKEYNNVLLDNNVKYINKTTYNKLINKGTNIILIGKGNKSDIKKLININKKYNNTLYYYKKNSKAKVIFVKNGHIINSIKLNKDIVNKYEMIYSSCSGDNKC